MRPNPNKPIIGENLLYILVWSMALLVPILNSKMMSEEHVYLVDISVVWSKLLPYIIIFVINNSLLIPRLLQRHHPIAYVAVSIVMLVAIFYPLEYFEDSLRHLPYTVSDSYVIHGRASFTDLAWYWNVLLGLFMMCANFGIKSVFKSIQDENKLAEMKRHSLQAEMDYLKYQFNPHFFMNTLNNIHALIDIDPDAAKETVIELSKMMRYVLYEAENEHTNLEQEVEFVDNYIKLMRIRYTSNVDVRMNIHRPIPKGVKVPPLLFIVFVENAFKHGVSYNEPSFVHIDIGGGNGYVTCEVCNSRHAKPSENKGGVGLENVRKRLDLIFGKDYQLLIDERRADEYKVRLSIPVTYDKVHNY